MSVHTDCRVLVIISEVVTSVANKESHTSREGSEGSEIHFRTLVVRILEAVEAVPMR